VLLWFEGFDDPLGAAFESDRSGFIPHQSVEPVEIGKLPGDHRFAGAYFDQVIALVRSITAEGGGSHIGNVARPVAPAPGIAKEKGSYACELHLFLPVELELDEQLTGAGGDVDGIIDNDRAKMDVIVEFFIEPAGEVEGIFEELESWCGGRSGAGRGRTQVFASFTTWKASSSPVRSMGA
jgi:hypothetical protein